jgi:hypothetical protein
LSVFVEPALGISRAGDWKDLQDLPMPVHALRAKHDLAVAIVQAAGI